MCGNGRIRSDECRNLWQLTMATLEGRNSWQLMVSCLRFYGHAISSRLKATSRTIQLCIKTTRTRNFSSRMGEHQAASKFVTSTFDIFLLPTPGGIQGNQDWVLPNRWDVSRLLHKASTRLSLLQVPRQDHEHRQQWSLAKWLAGSQECVEKWKPGPITRP